MENPAPLLPELERSHIRAVGWMIARWVFGFIGAELIVALILWLLNPGSINMDYWLVVTPVAVVGGSLVAALKIRDKYTDLIESVNKRGWHLERAKVRTEMVEPLMGLVHAAYAVSDVGLDLQDILDKAQFPAVGKLNKHSKALREIAGAVYLQDAGGGSAKQLWERSRVGNVIGIEEYRAAHKARIELEETVQSWAILAAGSPTFEEYMWEHLVPTVGSKLKVVLYLKLAITSSTRESLEDLREQEWYKVGERWDEVGA